MGSKIKLLLSVLLAAVPAAVFAGGAAAETYEYYDYNYGIQYSFSYEYNTTYSFNYEWGYE